MTNDSFRAVGNEIMADDIHAQSTMQLATSHDDVPWNCTVYFVLYESSFYWLSYPDRRHSQNLLHNPRAAIAIVIHPLQPVVGIQSEGVVKTVDAIAEAEKVLDLYVNKYGQGMQFMTLLKAGKNKHNLYRLSPERIIVFDERSDQAESPRELKIT